MTNQELVIALAKRLNITQKETSELLEATVSIFSSNLEIENSINIQGFGLFESKRKKQRVSVNPVSKQRYLVPPKISIAFKPGQMIKDNLKRIPVDE